MKIWEKKIGRKKIHFIMIILLSVFIIFPITRVMNVLSNQIVQGSGYTTKSWRESETMRYILKEKLDCPIYSNGVDVISFVTGKNVSNMPFKKRGAIEVATIESIKKTYRDAPNKR